MLLTSIKIILLALIAAFSAALAEKGLSAACYIATLSTVTRPDYESAVKEAVCALEASRKALFPVVKAPTLGDLVKWLGSTIEVSVPKAVCQTLRRLFTWSILLTLWKLMSHFIAALHLSLDSVASGISRARRSKAWLLVRLPVSFDMCMPHRTYSVGSGPLQEDDVSVSVLSIELASRSRADTSPPAPPYRWNAPSRGVTMATGRLLADAHERGTRTSMQEHLSRHIIASCDTLLAVMARAAVIASRRSSSRTCIEQNRGDGDV